MTDERLPSAAWIPSAIQREVAEYLAAGYSQNRTSQLVQGITLRSIQRWWAEIPEFREYVAEVRAELMAAQRPMFESTVAIAQKLVLMGLTGECHPDDPRVQLARDLLARTVWRIVQPGYSAVAEPIGERQLGPGGDAA